MLFVGGGALLCRAVKYAKRTNLAVDAVCCPAGDHAVSDLRQAGVIVVESNDPYSTLLPLLSSCEDKIAFSINNPCILGDELLNSDVSFFNIHNGLTQSYRGIAEVCVFAAICNGSPIYGATLHRVLAGQKVDTGPVVAQLSFRIGDDAIFSDVMSESLMACQRIFESAVAGICSGAYPLTTIPASERAYSYKDVLELCSRTSPARLARAGTLGHFSEYFPKLKSLLEPSRVSIQALPHR